MFSLKGKNAIVTGAGSGIGQAIAKSLAAQGAVVDILDVNLEGAAETVSSIESDGGTAATHECDVTDQARTLSVFEGIVDRRGSLNCLVNNAGIAHVGNVLNTSEDDYDRVMGVNAKGVYNCLKAGVTHMQENGGAIVNIASTVSVMAINDRFTYSTSKGAVLAMTYSVAKDYLKQNIRCNAILPGRIHTPFVDGFIAKNYPGREEEMFKELSEYQPCGRMGKPEEVAAMVVFLCSDGASYINGASIPIDGGFLHTGFFPEPT